LEGRKHLPRLEAWTGQANKRVAMLLSFIEDFAGSGRVVTAAGG
jgi:hypothetical protein